VEGVCDRLRESQNLLMCTPFVVAESSSKVVDLKFGKYQSDVMPTGVFGNKTERPQHMPDGNMRPVFSLHPRKKGLPYPGLIQRDDTVVLVFR
ncbi:hypothetical protein, partial [Klebsiella pneumoniae]|uniref:hypothetical protein n=1 Tax=Klebsiella pneumoniae TaxID=573 RepID=UPI00197AFC78